MCGLTGIVTASGCVPDRATLEYMNTVQAHRGPDQQGCLVMSGAGFGHRRLTILDPTSGEQPMQTEDGRYTLVYNGEIYNYRELNRTLEDAGFRFTGHCDTETLLRAWQHWGEDCVHRLRGMFAFAVWDAQEQRLFLARDRLGIKPLYYGWTADGDLVFGSELKTLMAHPRLTREIDPQALEGYLALGYVPDPFAIFKRTFKLPAGHRLSWQPGDAPPESTAYWDVDFEQKDAAQAGANADELRARLDEAVRMRLVADVPLGAFLSGGVDSSAVVSLMAGASDDPVKTCAIGFDHREYDESDYARKVSELFGTDHRHREVVADDYGLLDTLVQTYDEPFADSSALPTYRVCQLARQQVKVALSGDGGDENFAGYDRYKLHWAENRARARIPSTIRRPLFGVLGQVYPKMDWAPRVLRAKTTFQSMAMDAAQGHCHGVSLIPETLRNALYSDSFKRDLQGYRVHHLFQEHAERASTDDPLSLSQYLDFKTYLPGDILTKVDRASMAHGLEVRVPFLDHEFVNWSAGLAPGSKLHHGESKYVLKRAFEPLLPHDVLYRKKKGFSVPLAAWFRGPLREASRRAITEGTLPNSGIFKPHVLKQLWERHVSGRSDYSATLWCLLMLSRFLETLEGDNVGEASISEARRYA